MQQQSLSVSFSSCNETMAFTLESSAKECCSESWIFNTQEFKITRSSLLWFHHTTASHHKTLSRSTKGVPPHALLASHAAASTTISDRLLASCTSTYLYLLESDCAHKGWFRPRTAECSPCGRHVIPGPQAGSLVNIGHCQIQWPWSAASLHLLHLRDGQSIVFTFAVHILEPLCDKTYQCWNISISMLHINTPSYRISRSININDLSSHAICEYCDTWSRSTCRSGLQGLQLRLWRSQRPHCKWCKSTGMIDWMIYGYLLDIDDIVSIDHPWSSHIYCPLYP